MSAPTSGPGEPPGAVESSGPVEPRDASTVVLLRDGERGLQTWLLTRRTTLVFAAGMSVYPGGRVDPADAAVPLARPAGAAEIAQRFGIDTARAHALVVAAARETFEETGVLFSVPPVLPGSGRAAGLENADGLGGAAGLGRAAGPDDETAWEDVRARVEAHEDDFAAVLAARGLTVDGDAFIPWARWITPEAEPRRYDTFFFVAALPEGGRARDVTTESTSATWVDVAAALTSDAILLPPTMVTMERLGAHPRAADVVAAARAAADDSLVAIMPVLHQDSDDVAVTLPDGRRIPVQRLPSRPPT